MYDTNRFIHAAEPCAYHEAFAEDMRRCDNALGMGGLMAINAECWLDVLNGMTDTHLGQSSLQRHRMLYYRQTHFWILCSKDAGRYCCF